MVHKYLNGVALSISTAGLIVLVTSNAASAATTAPSLDAVIGNLRNWLVGLLASLATLFLTVGGIRYMLAGGDPGNVERAKSALRSAAVGYALAILAPLFISILQGVVG